MLKTLFISLITMGLLAACDSGGTEYRGLIHHSSPSTGESTQEKEEPSLPELPSDKDMNMESITHNVFYSLQTVDFKAGKLTVSKETEAPNKGAEKRRYSHYFVDNKKQTAEKAQASPQYCEFYFESIYSIEMIPKWEKGAELELGIMRQSWVNGQVSFEIMLTAPKQPRTWVKCVNVRDVEEMRAHVGKYLEMIPLEDEQHPHLPKGVKTIKEQDEEMSLQYMDSTSFVGISALYHVEDFSVSHKGLRNLYWRLCGEKVCLTDWELRIGAEPVPYQSTFTVDMAVVDKTLLKRVKENMKSLRLEFSLNTLVNSKPSITHVSYISGYCTTAPLKFKNLDTEQYGCVDTSPIASLEPFPHLQKVYFAPGTFEASFSEQFLMFSVRGKLNKESNFVFSEAIVGIPRHRFCLKNECSPWKVMTSIYLAKSKAEEIDYRIVLSADDFAKKVIASLPEVRIEFSLPEKGSQEEQSTHFIDLKEYCESSSEKFWNLDADKRSCLL